jgi:hypothetical protein
MGKFICKIFLFLSIFLLLISIGGTRLQHHEATPSDYMAAIVNKHKRLKSITGKRIIFAGGSNLALGIDSKKIERELNIPIINLGLHAGLGLNFIVEELKSNIKNEDIVIFSIEYFLEPQGEYGLKKLTASFFPESRSYFDFDLIQELSLQFKERKKNLKYNIEKIFRKKRNTKKKVIVKKSSVYSKESFNSYGDVVGHLNNKKSYKLKDGGKLRYRFYEGIEILNNFNQFAQAKNVKVYFMFPNYPKSEYLNNKDAIELHYSDLLKHLNIPLISRPQDFVFDDSMFFDTIYHLNKEGRRIRTEKIIAILKNCDL